MMMNGLRLVRACSTWRPVFSADVRVSRADIYARIGRLTTFFTASSNGIIVPRRDIVWIPFRMSLGSYSHCNIDLKVESELERVLEKLELMRAKRVIGEPYARIDSLRVYYVLMRMEREFSPH